ncbi:MAG: DNA polymerase III subunit gamma/tau [Ruminiclostridium sp.]|nr:DNA polymerase III subunit gamma/tau [Ruminiclostridium sp.]
MYLALYRKYRPQTFDDVISQEHITTTLKNQLINGQTSHAYLFTGSRGTGKTTCAKILAKAINCLDTKDGSPCLECEACRAVADECPDIIEIDAASNTGVDNVRALKEEAVYTPLTCKYKVYIIDEVHMLSTAAFNALLKLIEEPPAHVVFIFATTETHKIPATILSRCQRFDFRRIDIEDSKKRLMEIAEKEGMTLDDGAAFLISRISDGGMRDALSLLDQCFAASSHVTEEIVRGCAGISGTEHLFRIADAVITKNSADALSVLDSLVQRSKSASRLMEELVSHYRALMLLKAGADKSVLRISAEEEAQYRKQNEKYSMESILRAISILSDALSGKNHTGNEQLACEMCLIRLCTPTLDPDEKILSGRIDALERTVSDLVENSVKNALAGAISTLPVNNSVPEPVVEQADEPFTVEEQPEPAEEQAPVQIEQPSEEEELIPPPPEPLPVEEEYIPLPPEPMPIELPFDMEQPPEAEEKAEEIPAEPVQDAFPAEPVSLSEAIGLPPSEKSRPDDDPDKEPWKKDEPEDDEPKAEGYEPFKEWKQIIDDLPFSIRMLISDTTALINETMVMVCGSELQKTYAVKDFKTEIQTAVSRAIGRTIGLVAQPNENKGFAEEKNYVDDFLDYAKSQGVVIKEQ